MAAASWATSKLTSSTTRPATSAHSGPLYLAGAVVTFDALHTVRANLDWLAGEKKAHYIAVVKANQPLLYARVKALPCRQVPAGSTTRDAGHGRTETRALKTAHVSVPGLPRRPPGHQDHPVAAGHGHRENLPRDHLRHHQPDQRPKKKEAHHHIRDTAYREDSSTGYRGSGPQAMATCRNIAISLLYIAGVTAVNRTLQAIGHDRTRMLSYLPL